MAAAAAAQYGSALDHNRKLVEHCGGRPGMPGVKMVALTVTTNSSYTGAGGDDLDLSAFVPNKIVGWALSGVDSTGLQAGRFVPGTSGAPASCKLFTYVATSGAATGNSKAFELTVWGY